MKPAFRRAAALSLAALAFVCIAAGYDHAVEAQSALQVPTYQVDPAWPKPLPGNWILGSVVGVAVDARDHVWITHRPGTLQPNKTRSGWQAAPPVLEFDPAGNVVSAWGGPGAGYEWPELEHGMYVDAADNVWLGAGGPSDSHVLKFSRDGRFLMQIGRQGPTAAATTRAIWAGRPAWWSTRRRASSTSRTATSIIA